MSAAMLSVAEAGRAKNAIVRTIAAKSATRKYPDLTLRSEIDNRLLRRRGGAGLILALTHHRHQL
ncbi:MAG TPA: hypothetical protein VIU85_07265, partial [Chthoniobacterales bacterium]